MKFSIKKLVLIIIGLVLTVAFGKFIFGLYSTSSWSKLNYKILSCQYSNLIEIKDIEGNIFIFEDIDKNSNLKTNEITFNETKLGVKSLASINRSNIKLNYLSKNDQLTYNELVNIQNCFESSLITISNNYNFDKTYENKFCQFKFVENEKYEIVFCNQ